MRLLRGDVSIFEELRDGEGWLLLTVIKSLKQGFSTPELLTFWAGYFFVMGGCPMHYKILNTIPGLCPLDASKIYTTSLPSCDNQKCHQILPHVPWVR